MPPKRPQAPAAPPAPAQLPLFPDTAALARGRPEHNERRFHRLEIWPDLFGRALLLRHWGRIGAEGRCRLDPHSDSGAALIALAPILRAERHRGYWDRGA